MASDSYEIWRDALNKSKLKFFDGDSPENIQDDYTRLEMGKKAKLFKRLAMGDVQTALTDIWGHTKRNKIRILSLGCGPGSDLLGILGAVDSVLRKSRDAHGLPGWKTGELKCDCICVDAFQWTRDDFKERVTRLRTASVLGGISYRFVHQDMETFALNYHGGKFDFICLCYADAGRNLQLIGNVLPHLLSDFGRILVLDNNIGSVRRLARYGFKCVFAHNEVCMQTKPRRRQPNV